MDAPSFVALQKKWGIAITGGIATGKSTVSRFLISRGFLVIDADDLAKQVVLPGTPAYKQIKATFGANAIDTDGTVARPYLRKLIISDPSKKDQLEKIIHPQIHQAQQRIVEEFFAAKPQNYWFYTAALILEKNLEAQFCDVWLIDCPEDVQIERLAKRDHLSKEEAYRTLKIQMSRSERLRRVSTIINSDCTFAEIEKQIKSILETLIPQKGNSYETTRTGQG